MTERAGIGLLGIEQPFFAIFRKVPMKNTQKHLRQTVAMPLRNLFLVAAMFLPGCRSAPRQPSEERAQFPGQLPGMPFYEVLEPVSVSFMERMAEQQYDTVDAFISGVGKRMDEPEKLACYLDCIAQMNECNDIRKNPQWRHFKERLRAGDSVCYFDYQNGDYGDFGLLVLRNGKIVYRSKWGAQIRGKEKLPIIEDIDLLDE
ncbi:MAG: hypothetical protein IJS32_05395 [Kiritimatiellae bacterium]|nr:hypothetical protein [Kiritimatiellia bacterium]